MHVYYVSLGSNFNAEFNVAIAGFLLGKCFNHVMFTDVMKTESIGLCYHCWYLNQMVKLVSPLSLEQMEFALKSLEIQIGRKKHSNNVAIDLDLVEVDGVVVHKDYYKYPFLDQLRKQFNTQVL